MADGWIGMGVGMGVWGDLPCMHTHTHTCVHMHAHTHMHVKHAKHGCLHAGSHLQFYTCVCVCVRMHTHVCGDTPHAPRYPQTPPTHLPPPQSAGSPKHQISITLELIKIIRFCLKILYLRTFLNSYRL